MRACLRTLPLPDHIGLAYDSWAPVDETGKVPDVRREKWLAELCDRPVAPDYRLFFERYKAVCTAGNDRQFELALVSRLLVGHGSSSATGVGLTVHHTWGTPTIPGPAIKGALGHYLAETYKQADFRATLMGQLDSAGAVVFHDALYVPGSCEGDKPYAPDVLTVHQKHYYDSAGGTWPNDYESPTPIGFITVRPGSRLFFALSGPADWTALSEGLLRDALREWGVGGKTSAGYGRLESPAAAPTGPPPKPHARVEVVLLPEKTKKGGWMALHEASGARGYVINSDQVPASYQPGNRIALKVERVEAGGRFVFKVDRP